MLAEILSLATSCGTWDICQNFSHYVGHLCHRLLKSVLFSVGEMHKYKQI